MNNSKNQLEEALSQGNSMSEDENEKSLIHILDSEDWLQRSEDHFNSTSWVGSNSWISVRITAILESNFFHWLYFNLLSSQSWIPNRVLSTYPNQQLAFSPSFRVARANQPASNQRLMARSASYWTSSVRWAANPCRPTKWPCSASTRCWRYDDRLRPVQVQRRPNWSHWLATRTRSRRARPARNRSRPRTITSATVFVPANRPKLIGWSRNQSRKTTTTSVTVFQQWTARPRVTNLPRRRRPRVLRSLRQRRPSSTARRPPASSLARLGRLSNPKSRCRANRGRRRRPGLALRRRSLVTTRATDRMAHRPPNRAAHRRFESRRIRFRTRPRRRR